MRLLVNGVSAHTGGGATFLLSQLAAMAHRTDVEVTAYVSEEMAGRFRAEAHGVRVVAIPRRSLLLRLLWEQVRLPLAARQFDLVYMPGNFALFLSPAPQLVVLQNSFHFGRQARAVRRLAFPMRSRIRFTVESRIARLTVQRATALVSVSRALKHAVEEDIGPCSKLRVLRSGAPDAPRTVVRQPQDYVLSIANDYPHKDWDGLIRTFVENSDLPKLLLVGAPAGSARRIQLERDGTALDGTRRVQLLGRIDDADEIDALHRGAKCFVAHSRLESFGFTPLEALARGVPVAASDLPSHREVCESAARYYDPSSRSSLADAVRHAISAPRGHPPRALNRSWRENVDELFAIFDEMLRQTKYCDSERSAPERVNLRHR